MKSLHFNLPFGNRTGGQNRKISDTNFPATFLFLVCDIVPGPRQALSQLLTPPASPWFYFSLPVAETSFELRPQTTDLPLSLECWDYGHEPHAPPVLFLKGRGWGSSVGRQGGSLKFLEAILESFLGSGEVFCFSLSFLFLIQGLTCNSEFSCLCLLSAKVIGMNHHTWHISEFCFICLTI